MICEMNAKYKYNPCECLAEYNAAFKV
uniref:Uncharacterized protein n=1 Tax=Anguilla anguilla TaxID=7936 RepID=A0A0E9PN78_ANGAN